MSSSRRSLSRTRGSGQSKKTGMRHATWKSKVTGMWTMHICARTQNNATFKRLKKAINFVRIVASCPNDVTALRLQMVWDFHSMGTVSEGIFAKLYYTIITLVIIRYSDPECIQTEGFLGRTNTFLEFHKLLNCPDRHNTWYKLGILSF